MNKAELVDAVSKSLGNGNRAEAERAVNAVIESIKTGIRKDRSVQLVGFGTFRVAERAARMGVNPKTGEKIKIKKSRTVKFAVGKELKDKL
jgi:DNA-binding protein HU-beta